jgi:hypothetical protein
METPIDPYEKFKKKKKKKKKGDESGDHPIHEKYTEMDYSEQKK